MQIESSKYMKVFSLPLYIENLKFHSPYLKALFKTYIPRPVKLTHYLSSPIVPPKINDESCITDDMVEKFHLEIINEMKLLMKNIDY